MQMFPSTAPNLESAGRGQIIKDKRCDEDVPHILLIFLVRPSILTVWSHFPLHRTTNAQNSVAKKAVR